MCYGEELGRGESECCQGQSRLCLDKWLKSVLLRAGHCFGELISGQIRVERRGFLSPSLSPDVPVGPLHHSSVLHWYEY